MSAPSGLRIGFYGGVGEVTGSRHLLEFEGTRVLLDCGLFQGHRKEAIAKNRSFPFKPADLSAVILSHAHIDHSGSLPILAKAGYRGPIHCTESTADLCRIMLMDSAHLQVSDAKFFNKIHQNEGLRIEPLYGEEDAAACLALFESKAYNESFSLGPKVRATLLNAGHVLGSAMPFLEFDTPAGIRRVLFTGDLGRRETILMDPPEPPKDVDYLVIESTYGDRVHNTLVNVGDQLVEVVRRAVEEKGRVLIPSFALERTQEIVFILERLRREGRIPAIPVFVNSPMAVNITEVFNRNLDSFSFDPRFKAYVAKEGDPFGFETVRYVRAEEDSKRLNEMSGPYVLIAGSGMCEGGRILHHLRNLIGDDTTTILIVGYQAEGTLGRRLLDGAKKVKIFGLEHEVWARVQTLQTLSAHADKDDLIWFIRGLEPRPRKIFLVHGDPDDRLALREHLRAAGVDRVELPDFKDVFDL